MKKRSKALVFFAVSNQIPIVYSADGGRAKKRKHNFSWKIACQMFVILINSLAL